ncbi:hypothetical protein [Streptomyces capitiformicae]|uniref:Uncharacterized protein n=1 Tax=Streptomyces capitiformicae TaxID=2014920 RepID=A0A918ZKW6_9ACTN|nr:hypothetical protein [Streptomyces capitiformicae]GHE56876.1 hypothetical protein GCM10017771_79620 [Streptomyces capitiformicae]
MNRLGLGLAIGAGYVLGRTKKMKLAFGVGTIVAGERPHLSPRALADLVSHQLRNNPQFKEMGDQLREDLRGTGKAATGALLEDRLEALADHLHARTARVRDQQDPAPPAFEERGLGRSPGDGTGRGGGDAQAQRLPTTLGRKLGETAVKVNDIAKGKGNVLGTLKPTVIIESVDVGVPVRTAYDQWTRFQSTTHTIEQVSGGRIAWTSQGANGTRGRRARLDLKNFVRFSALRGIGEDFEEDIDEEPYEDEDVERATVGGSRR